MLHVHIVFKHWHHKDFPPTQIDANVVYATCTTQNLCQWMKLQDFIHDDDLDLGCEWKDVHMDECYNNQQQSIRLEKSWHFIFSKMW